MYINLHKIIIINRDVEICADYKDHMASGSDFPPVCFSFSDATICSTSCLLDSIMASLKPEKSSFTAFSFWDTVYHFLLVCLSSAPSALTAG